MPPLAGARRDEAARARGNVVRSASVFPRMFDLGRAVALAWALVAAFRARAWAEAALLGATTYAIVLEIFSGMTVQSLGPIHPMYAMLLVFMGPSAMPRGPLPPLPFASAVIHSPALVDGAMTLALAAASVRVVIRMYKLPDFSVEAARWRRLALPLVFVAVVQAIGVGSRFLPDIIGGDL